MWWNLTYTCFFSINFIFSNCWSYAFARSQSSTNNTMSIPVFGDPHTHYPSHQHKPKAMVKRIQMWEKSTLLNSTKSWDIQEDAVWKLTEYYKVINIFCCCSPWTTLTNRIHVGMDTKKLIISILHFHVHIKPV